MALSRSDGEDTTTAMTGPQKVDSSVIVATDVVGNLFSSFPVVKSASTMADLDALFGGGDDSDSDSSSVSPSAAPSASPPPPPAPVIEYGAPLSLVNQPLLLDGSTLSSSYGQLPSAQESRATNGPCKKDYGGTRAPVTNAKTSLHFTKLPNFVGIESQPFDKDLFDEDEQEQKFKFTHSIVRWRYKVSAPPLPPVGDDVKNGACPVGRCGDAPTERQGRYYGWAAVTQPRMNNYWGRRRRVIARPRQHVKR